MNAMPAPAPRRSLRIRTPDGVDVAVQEWGNPDGPEILFIHGYLQSHLSWAAQVSGTLAQRFRMVTYDLRGHGDSGQPTTPDAYRDPGRWADELAAVIAQSGLRRPVLVPWSYAGRVVGDFLGRHGAGGIAGIAMVGSRTRADPRWTGPRHPANQALMVADSLSARLDGTYRFLCDCAVAWEPELLVRAMGVSMSVPATVRSALQGRPYDADAVFAGLPVPLLVVHGDADRVVRVEAAHHTASLHPAADLSIYAGVGHSPFMERPDRFDAELAAFVARCAAQPG